MSTRQDDGGAFKLSLDAWLFLGFAAAGVGLMWVLKAFGIAQGTITAVIVGVVLLYMVTVLSVKRLRLRLDQAGDNAYYLGLIFTLSSMAFALAEIGRRVAGEGGTNGISAAEAVIGDFGLALGSTLAGIVCRILLHQMRQDPGDVEAASRLELAQSATRMRYILEGVTSEFGQFLLELRQKQGDHATELAATHAQMRQQLSESLQAALTQSREALQSTTERIDASLQGLAVATTQGAEALVGATERLNAVEPPPTRLSKRFTTMAEEAQSVSEQLATSAAHIAATLNRLSEAADIVERVASNSKDVVPRVAAELDAQHRRFDERMQVVDNKVVNLASNVGALRDDIQVLAEQARASASAVSVSEQSAVEVIEGLKQVVVAIDERLQRTP